MTAPSSSPMVDLDGVTRLRFDYDGEDDIALFHVGGPRPAVTEDVGDGWYLRLVDDEIAGLELHGLRRRLLTTPFYARLFRPAIRELEQLSGQTLEADRLVVDAAPEAVPMTTRLLLLLVGQALTRLETIQRAEYEAAAGRLRSAN